MKKVELRYQRVSDAKRFYEMLKNPNFIYYAVNPKSVEDQKNILRQNAKKRKMNINHNFTIMYDGKIVGACGIKIDQHRSYVGELTYFVDESYWNKGIATEAVRLLEGIGFNKLNLIRIEILTIPENVASRQIAIKNGYKEEGKLAKKILNRGKYKDAFLYAKVK